MSETDHFVLKDAQQVETAYIAAHITDVAPDLHFQLKFLTDYIHPQDQVFEARGQRAGVYHRQAVDSLERLSVDQAYSQYTEAAGHLLGILRSKTD